MDFMM